MTHRVRYATGTTEWRHLELEDVREGAELFWFSGAPGSRGASAVLARIKTFSTTTGKVVVEEPSTGASIELTIHQLLGSDTLAECDKLSSMFLLAVPRGERPRPRQR